MRWEEMMKGREKQYEVFAYALQDWLFPPQYETFAARLKNLGCGARGGIESEHIGEWNGL